MTNPRAEFKAKFMQSAGRLWTSCDTQEQEDAVIDDFFNWLAERWEPKQTAIDLRHHLKMSRERETLLLGEKHELVSALQTALLHIPSLQMRMALNQVLAKHKPSTEAKP